MAETRRNQQGDPVPEFVDQMVISPHAFLRMVSALGNTVKQMQEQGMLGEAQAEAEAEAEAEAD